VGRRKGWGTSFGRSDELKLLDVITVARNLAIKMGSASGYGTERYQKGHALTVAIDVLAEEFTSDPTHFHAKPSTTPGAGELRSPISMRFKPDIDDGLLRYIDEQEAPMMREDAVEAIVTDALIGLGLLDYAEPPNERREDAN
jgi:hypothetical protein